MDGTDRNSSYDCFLVLRYYMNLATQRSIEFVKKYNKKKQNIINLTSAGIEPTTVRSGGERATIAPGCQFAGREVFLKTMYSNFYEKNLFAHFLSMKHVLSMCRRCGLSHVMAELWHHSGI